MMIGDDLIVDPESKLQEEIIVRPTSETVIWSMYKSGFTLTEICHF